MSGFKFRHDYIDLALSTIHNRKICAEIVMPRIMQLKFDRESPINHEFWLDVVVHGRTAYCREYGQQEFGRFVSQDVLHFAARRIAEHFAPQIADATAEAA